MYYYFVRCSSLTSATVLLVENGLLAAAYALQKSVVDSMLNGLYIGYVAKDSEINRLIVETYQGPSAMVGRGAVTMVATATAIALLIHR